jgi:hypothetical protein
MVSGAARIDPVILRPSTLHCSTPVTNGRDGDGLSITRYPILWQRRSLDIRLAGAAQRSVAQETSCWIALDCRIKHLSQRI